MLLSCSVQFSKRFATEQWIWGKRNFARFESYDGIRMDAVCCIRPQGICSHSANLLVFRIMITSPNGNKKSVLLALCAGNSMVTGEFPSQRPVTLNFDVFFDLCLSKQPWSWWYETPSRSLWRHCIMYVGCVLEVLNNLPLCALAQVTTWLYLSAYGVNSFTFSTLFPYTSEIYPTLLRGFGLGFTNGVGKVAAIAGPFLMKLVS